MYVTVRLSLLFIFALKEAVTALHSPVNVRAEAVDESRVIVTKWLDQVGVPYYKVGIRYKHMYGTTTFHTGPAAARSFYLSADNVTRSYCIRTMGGSCPKEFANFSRSGLGPGRQWTYGTEIEIRAGACSSNDSSSCLMSSFKTYKIPFGVPDAVYSVVAKDVGGGSIEVSWEPPPEPRGPLTKYIVTYKSTKGDQKTKQTDGIKSYVTITGLEPNTNYTFWVTAYNVQYEGKKSDNVTQLTSKDVCRPNPCQNSGTCSVNGLKADCNCLGDWKGTTCGEPKGYKLVAGKCFEAAAEKRQKLITYYNRTLASCEIECRKQSNPVAMCKSFVYKLGYVNDDESTADQRTKGLGRCSLYRTANETLVDVPCSGDYYEVVPQDPHSGTTSLQTGLTSLFISLPLLLVSRV